MFSLGQKVRDSITGFEGIATARVDYLNGCTQFCITPRCDKDGKMVSAEYFDHQRLELVDDGPDLRVVASDTGGVMSDQPSTTYRG